MQTYVIEVEKSDQVVFVPSKSKDKHMVYIANLQNALVSEIYKLEGGHFIARYRSKKLVILKCPKGNILNVRYHGKHTQNDTLPHIIGKLLSCGDRWAWSQNCETKWKDFISRFRIFEGMLA